MEYGKAVIALRKVSASGLNKLSASLEMKAFGYEDDTSVEVKRYRNAKVRMSNMILRATYNGCNRELDKCSQSCKFDSN